MTPERLQLLRMIRDGEEPGAPPSAPHHVRRQAAEHIDAALHEQLISSRPVFVLTLKGKHMLEHAEAMDASRAGPGKHRVLGGAGLVLPGALPHADLGQMADYLAGFCQSQINAMPHGRINLVVVVHAGDPSQLPGAPAFAYAMAGNMTRRDQIVLLREQLRVLRDQELLEQAAASVAPAVEVVGCQGCNDKKWTPGVNAEGVKMQVPCPWCRP